MYKCKNCGGEFSEPLVLNDNGEKWDICPFCRGTEIHSFEDYKICELCGDFFLAEDSKHNECCQSCANIIKRRFVEMYCKHFAPFERDVINTELDGKDLIFEDD